MQRIDTATKSPDLFGAGKHGYKDGNVSLGVPATQLNAAVFNAIQEEISNVIEASGAALNPASFTQLVTAINALIVAGAPAIPSAAEAQAQSNNTKTITPLRLSDALKGANQSLTTDGFQVLPGGLIIQWMTAVESATSSSSVNFPIAFPNAVLAIIGTPISTSISQLGGCVVHSFTNSSLIFRCGDAFGNGTSGFVIALGH